jgi:dihydrodipicolinate synthase/N-acetylneuraminate lyase
LTALSATNLPVPERAEQLCRAARARHEATAARAEAAFETLQRAAKPVNFGQLAKAAGVSRSWLYRQPEIRQKVERLRGAPSQRRQGAQSAQRTSADSLRQQLRTYREELARLRAENAALKERLARQLGATRAASVTKIS